jgi:PAS domain S-box-containing protein
VWLAYFGASALVEILGFALWPSGPVRLYLLNVGQCASAAGGWLLLRRLARASKGGPLAGFWRLVSWSYLFWALSYLVFMVLQTVFGVQGLPGWQDLLLVPAYAGLFLAFLGLPASLTSASARINGILETAALLTATLLVGWHYQIHEDAVRFLQRPSLATGFLLLYPTADVGLLWLLFARARSTSSLSLSAGTYCWLIGGLFALVIADFSFPNILVAPSLWQAASLSELGWGFFSCCWGVAFLVQLRDERSPRAPDIGKLARSRQAILVVITSVWVVAMVLLLLFGLFTAEAGHRSVLLAVGVVAVLALVSARQIREVVYNEQLNRVVGELKNSREQFRQLFQLFPDAALLSRVDDGVFVEVNEGFTRNFGFKYEECVGQSALDLRLWVHEDDRAAFVKELRERGRVVQLEGRTRHKDGAILPVEMSARLVEFDGTQYILNLVRDLSERKAAEEHLKRNEKELERAQRLEAIGGLAGGIAHDVNNMLTPIMSGTELTLLELPQDHPSRSGLEQVLEASKRARDMVRQILTFSRRTEAQAERVDSGPIVKEVLRQIQQQVPAAVRVLHQRRSPPVVIGDPTQIHQVLLNLCMNAAYSLRGRPEGVIEVVEESFRPDTSVDLGADGFVEQTYLHISVRDTGCGMSAEVQERIFEPFYTTRRTGEGTGLGLAVVHGIVHQHAGRLKVYSSLGEGSIFHVYLPAAAEAASQLDEAESRGAPAGKGREIACVDDDPMVLAILVRLLGHLGFRVRGFGSAFEAYGFLTGPLSERTEAVVCDFAMPEMDGITLSQKVGLKRDGLFWVLLSGYLSGDTLRRARAAGLEHFVDKPPAAEQLARVLGQHFESLENGGS